MRGQPKQQKGRALHDVAAQARVRRELARRIGNPNAQRAVGAANGQNPVSIIIPCHRVIGSNGSLTGFGGGLPTKRALLELEQGGQSRLAL